MFFEKYKRKRIVRLSQKGNQVWFLISEGWNTQTKVLVKKISFTELKRGDRFLVETLLGQTIDSYDITVTGKRKAGLLVSVKKVFGKEVEEFTAIMPGGFVMITGNLTPYIQVATEKEQSCLFFKNPKDARTQEKTCSSSRTTPIRKITLFKTVRQ